MDSVKLVGGWVSWFASIIRWKQCHIPSNRSHAVAVTMAHNIAKLFGYSFLGFHGRSSYRRSRSSLRRFSVGNLCQRTTRWGYMGRIEEDSLSRGELLKEPQVEAFNTPQVGKDLVGGLSKKCRAARKVRN